MLLVQLYNIIWFSTTYAVEIFGEAWKIPQRKEQKASDNKLQQLTASSCWVVTLYCGWKYVRIIYHSVGQAEGIKMGER